MSWLDAINDYKNQLMSKGVSKHMANSLADEAVIGYVGRCATDKAWLEHVKRNPHLRDDAEVSA
mgnify:CR=1 FL=1